MIQVTADAALTFYAAAGQRLKAEDALRTEAKLYTVISDRDRLIGAAVAAARGRAGWSRERLAPILVLTANELREAEMGARRLQTTELLEIANILSVPTSSLLTPILANDRQRTVGSERASRG